MITNLINTSGFYRLRRVNRETGQEIITPWTGNTVTSTGKNRLCRQIVGLDNAAMNQSSTKLVLKTSGGSTIKTLDCAAAPSHSGRTATWKFEDISIDTYTIGSVEIQRSGSPSYTFSTASPSFSGGNSKPNSENWFFEYQLTLNGGSAFSSPTDNPPLFPGLELMLRRFTGNTSNHWSNPILMIYSSPWPGLSEPIPFPADGSIGRQDLTVSDNVITWTYVTSGENMRWENVIVARVELESQMLAWLSVGRTKSSPSTWEYNLELTIN